MGDIPIYLSSLPEARVLADLESLSHDLRLVIEITKLLEIEKDSSLMRALFAAGLITYRRCFTSGVRNGLTRSDVATIPDNAIGLHDYLRAQADKLIAHSVNPFEHTQVGILVKDDKPIGVATLSVQLSNFDPTQLTQWRRLSSVILETIVQPRIEEAKKATLEAVAKVPITDVVKAPLLEYEPAKPHQATDRRS